MNNTFVTWLLGAAIAGLGLLLLLGTPAAVSSTTAAGSASLTTNGAAPAPETTSYWQGVTSAPTSTSAPMASTTAAAHCSSCATSHSSAGSPVAPLASSVPVAATSVGKMGGCGIPGAPCAEMPCGAIACRAATPCGQAACAAASPCGSAVPCGNKASCAVPLCDDRPRINRNGPSCVDECSFVQLYSTVPLPVCTSIRFAWAATRGQFLDAASPTPIYFTPGTGFAGGEDVLISLTVTDAQGNEYSDQMKLHVNDAH